MNRLLLTCVMAFAIFYAHATDISSISNAFKIGDASSLASAMDTEVDIAVPKTSKKCDGKNAVTLLTSFFKTVTPSGFNIVHHAEKNDNGFFVGKLQTSSAEFRVNITYRSEGNKAIIQSIRIE